MKEGRGREPSCKLHTKRTYTLGFCLSVATGRTPRELRNLDVKHVTSDGQRSHFLTGGAQGGWGLTLT